jgi:hypothetical protein
MRSNARMTKRQGAPTCASRKSPPPGNTLSWHGLARLGLVWLGLTWPGLVHTGCWFSMSRVTKHLSFPITSTLLPLPKNLYYGPYAISPGRVPPEKSLPSHGQAKALGWEPPKTISIFGWCLRRGHLSHLSSPFTPSQL